MNKFKSFTIMLGVFLLAFTTSCTKENPQDNPQNGQFAPGKKIHKIYVSTVHNDEKVLLETWHWNGDKLESIDHYGDYDAQLIGQRIGEERFTYDENRLIRVDYDFIKKGNNSTLFNDGYYTLFNYEGGVLSSIDVYESYIENYHQSYTLYYQDGKLSVVDRRRSNSQTIEDIRLTWDGDNLVRLVFNGDENNGYWFEYDTKNNPMYGRPYYDFIGCLIGNWNDYRGPFVSKNNCTMVKEDMHKDGTFNMYYVYDEDDYPIRQALGTVFYHYEYE